MAVPPPPDSPLEPPMDWLDWLKTEDSNISYEEQTKDVRPGQNKMESMKTETCHMAEHCRERERERDDADIGLRERT